MNPDPLEPYLLHIAALQGAVPREQCEELIRLGQAGGTPRERLMQNAGLAPADIDAILLKHAGAFARKNEAAFAGEAERLGFAPKAALDECLKNLEEFAGRGFTFTLDELIVKRGVLTADQARQIRTVVEKEIIICPVCLSHFRNAMKKEMAEVHCARCKARFAPWAPAAKTGAPAQTPAGGVQAVSSTAPGVLPERIGDYKILAELGRGGMGVVYEAEQISLKRKVALKVAPASLALNAESIERFHREAMALAKINHPNIVQVFGSGQYAGSHFYAMEFVEGRRVDEMLRETRVDLNKAADLARQVAGALQAAHDARVIHRDVKPANILVDGRGQAHLMDFGLARGDEDVGLTLEGIAVGTPAYMAPEQAMGKRSMVGPLSDVYSLGATLYTMVTGHAPYLGQTPEAILQLVISREPVSPLKWNKSLPPELETIIQQSMRRDPPKRYASAKAMADDLGRFVAGEAIAARPISAIEKLLRFVRRGG